MWFEVLMGLPRCGGNAAMTEGFMLHRDAETVLDYTVSGRVERRRHEPCFDDSGRKFAELLTLSVSHGTRQ
jgi:hypothetical protein